MYTKLHIWGKKNPYHLLGYTRPTNTHLEQQQLHSQQGPGHHSLPPQHPSNVHVFVKFAKLGPLQCIRTATGWQKEHLIISLALQIPKMTVKTYNQPQLMLSTFYRICRASARYIQGLSGRSLYNIVKNLKQHCKNH